MKDMFTKPYTTLDNMTAFKDIEQMGQSFSRMPLRKEEIPADPIELFTAWFEEQRGTNCEAPNAMVLSTTGMEGYPDARVVLLKGVDNGEFVFYTNYKSQKGVAIAMDNKVSALFYWAETQRQVRIVGNAEKVEEALSDAYFASRPYESQLSAIASPQSQPLSSREELEGMLNATRKKHPEGTTVRPKNWGGYKIKPVLIEFWQGGEHRLHDRITYKNSTSGWKKKRLAP